MREGDPPGVPVIELHGDQVPVVLQAQQTWGKRGVRGGPRTCGSLAGAWQKGRRDQPVSSSGARGRVLGGAERGLQSPAGPAGHWLRGTSRPRGHAPASAPSQDPLPGASEDAGAGPQRAERAGEGTGPECLKTVSAWSATAAFWAPLGQGLGSGGGQEEGTRFLQGNPAKAQAQDPLCGTTSSSAGGGAGDPVLHRRGSQGSRSWGGGWGGSEHHTE